MAVLKVTLFHTKGVSRKVQTVFNNQVSKGNAVPRNDGIQSPPRPE